MARRPPKRAMLPMCYHCTTGAFIDGHRSEEVIYKYFFDTGHDGGAGREGFLNTFAPESGT